MSSKGITEVPLQFGQGGRLFGILNLPPNPASLPVVVFLNAGLMHRVGPYRLYVRLAREVADLGFPSLRFDLAGVGDSPPQENMTNKNSVAADFEEILAVLEPQFADLKLVLVGLCTGSDNALMLGINNPRVVGMVLLDPICFRDRGFKARELYAKYTDASRYIAWLKRKFKRSRPTTLPSLEEEAVKSLSFRDTPTLEQMRLALESIRDRNGRVLSIFTRWALSYYNKQGQMGHVLGVENYANFCTEFFWPDTEHTYRLDLHRRRLINEIKSWLLSSFGHNSWVKSSKSMLLESKPLSEASNIATGRSQPHGLACDP